MIRVVREGHAPNCSSVGSTVGLAIGSAVIAAGIVNAWADRFFRWTTGEEGDGEGGRGGGGDGGSGPDRGKEGDRDATGQGRSGGAGSGVVARVERGGVLVKVEDPPALMLVDGADAATALRTGRVVGGDSAVDGAFSAPTEVHVALGTRCPVACRSCYLDAGPAGVDAEWTALVADLERLAASGVLEVALGGGEATFDERILPLGREIRRLGMVPNVTTSGFGVVGRAAEFAAVFGQINVSLDGLGDAYRAVRGWDGTDTALAAISALLEAGARVGVNTVLTRTSDLEALGERLIALGVTEWQWLRLKPSGRAVRRYEADRLEREQIRRLYPLACAFEARGLRVRWDCALVPFLADHAPDPAVLERLGIWGCPGGVALMARDPAGRWQGCSFDADSHEGAPQDAWRALAAWRPESRPEPCNSCNLQVACRGGCRVVARHVAGDSSAPDPECPRVTG